MLHLVVADDPLERVDDFLRVLMAVIVDVPLIASLGPAALRRVRRLDAGDFRLVEPQAESEHEQPCCIRIGDGAQRTGDTDPSAARADRDAAEVRCAGCVPDGRVELHPAPHIAQRVCGKLTSYRSNRSGASGRLGRALDRAASPTHCGRPWSTRRSSARVEPVLELGHCLDVIERKPARWRVQAQTRSAAPLTPACRAQFAQQKICPSASMP